MTAKDIKEEIEILKNKMHKEYTTMGNTKRHQEMYKRYEELENILKTKYKNQINVNHTGYQSGDSRLTTKNYVVDTQCVDMKHTLVFILFTRKSERKVV